MRAIAEALVHEGTSWLPERPIQRAVPMLHQDGVADAFVGLRRVGKTWRMLQHLHDLLDHGTPRDEILYVNFEDERARPRETALLTHLEAAWVDAVPALSHGGGHLLLDEIQVIPGWESFVRRMLESRRHRVVLSGSSADLLSGELATALRGRATAHTVWPLGLVEWERFAAAGRVAGHTDAARGSSRQRITAFLRTGGLPDIIRQPDDVLRAQRAREVADVVVLRDVAQRHDIRNVAALQGFVHRMLGNTARPFSIHGVLQQLRSQGVKVGKDSLHAWFEAVRSTHLVHAVPFASRSVAHQQVNPVKLYVADTALARHHSPLGVPGDGHLLETVVHAHLRRLGFDLGWVRTMTGREVDFLATHPDGRRWLVQVTWSLDDDATAARELGGLAEAMQMLQHDRALIVTLDEDGGVPTEDGHIEIIGADGFLRTTP